jgi:hypothetical protein
MCNAVASIFILSSMWALLLRISNQNLYHDAGIVKSEKTVIVRQRLVETWFHSNEYAGINQHITQRLTQFAKQQLPKTFSHVRDSTKVLVDTGNLGITGRFCCNGYAE